MRRALLALGVGALAGCPTTLAPDDVCKEVGYAIAGRSEECTGRTDDAEARYEAFAADYTCAELDLVDTGAAVRAEDLYACPLAIRELPCELVEDYGDDLDRWLTASPVCAVLVEAK